MNDFAKKAFAKIIPASRFLQSFASKGKVRKSSVAEARKVMQKAKENIGIGEFCQQHLSEMEAVMESIKNKGDHEDIIEKATFSLANFVANVGTFGGEEYTTMSAVVLRWLESVETVDEDVEDIITGYNTAITSVFSGDSVEVSHVAAFATEMNKACERYFAKHKDLNLTQEVSNKNLLYVSELSMDKENVMSEDISDDIKQPDFITDKETE